jgi:hypothetical protein
LKIGCSLLEEVFENTAIPTPQGSFKNIGITFKNFSYLSWNYIDTCASDILQKGAELCCKAGLPRRQIRGGSDLLKGMALQCWLSALSRTARNVVQKEFVSNIALVMGLACRTGVPVAGSAISGKKWVW